MGTPGGKRIIVADDDPDIRSLVSDVVSRATGMELVGAAGDADEAVRLAHDLLPDVVVLDWAMPGGGDQAALLITKAHPSMRVVAISAMDEMEASYVMQTAGAVAFLSKPFKPAELTDVIESAARW